MTTFYGGQPGHLAEHDRLAAFTTDAGIAALVSAGGPTEAALNATYASQLDGTGKTVTQINSWLAAPSSLGIKRLVGTPSINAPLVIPSGTHLDASGATITLASGSNCNMLQNVNAASATTRDAKIRITGGDWERGANGGTGNASHSLFLRHVDDIRIENVTINSTGGKYCIALGDVTQFTVRGVRATAVASDTVHITGPASHGLVEDVRVGTGGDDIVAFTTTDYVAYNDVSGPISDVSVRNISGSNTTRAVLVSGSASGAADGFSLSAISVSDVTQLGAGGSLTTALSASDTATITDLTVARVNGGLGIRLTHQHHGNVTIEDCTAATGHPLIQVTPDTAGTVLIDQMTIRGVTKTSSSLLQVNSTAVTLSDILIDNCIATGTSVCTIPAAASVGSLRLRRVTFAGTADAVPISGAYTLGTISLSECSFTCAATMHVVKVNNTATVNAVKAQRSTFAAADTNSGIMVITSSSTATVKSVSITDCDLTAMARVLDVPSGSTGNVNLFLSGVTATGCNRLAQVAGAALLVLYSGVVMASMINQPFRVFGAGSLTIKGRGWSGYTSAACVNSTGEAMHVQATDFPADASTLAKASGDECTNTNASLSCGAGRVISDGTNWKNLYTGATY